jgi:anthranilate synthase component 1
MIIKIHRAVGGDKDWVTIFGVAVVEPLSPSAERLDTKHSPRDLFAKFLSRYENTFLLESATGKSRLAEYSFIGFDPSSVVSAKDGTLEARNEETGSNQRIKTRDPVQELRRLVPPDSVSRLFRFVGGAVGYISYDSIRGWEKLPNNAVDELLFPDFQFGIYKDGIVYDHGRNEVYYYHLGKGRIEEVREVLRSREVASPLKVGNPKSATAGDEFEKMVRAAKEYIFSGDVFQVVLSKRYDLEVEGDLAAFYFSLSAINPSPYMYFLKFGKTRIIGSSPEMLVRIEDRRVETFPIAGTRPHLENKLENAKLTRELLADPKENAEHVMLVDLARNDVGKVSKYGSVTVPEFLAVEQFSHVQHIVSHVIGELRDDLDSYDAFKAVFPAGTVSGAPKVRAMEIIEELEQRKRGPYAGAVGYFSFNGNADFAITIRTLVSKDRKCSIQSGAGIVADSVPKKEWDETEAKAAGLLKALLHAEGTKRSKSS